MKHIIIACLIICILSGSINALIQNEYVHSTDGEGVFSTTGTSLYKVTTKYTNNGAETLNYTLYITGSGSYGGNNMPIDYYYRIYPDMGTPSYFCENCYGPRSYTRTSTLLSGRNIIFGVLGETVYTISGDSTIIITSTEIENYYVYGDVDCIDDVSLYIKTFDDSYTKINYNDSATAYNFTITDGYEYRLIFSDAHIYDFECNGSAINYNYDACTHTQYRFEESCGNLIPDSEGTYTEYDGFWATIWDFYAPSGILDISNSSATKIAVHSHTFIGDTGWIIDPVVADTTYTLENPNIAWWLKVIVINDSDGSLIDDAMVKVDQSCYCTCDYSIRQKITINGMVEFGEMSLQDASLLVMKTGYKICNENTTGYNAFLSGRTNFSGKTWVVKLAPTWSENVSTFYESQNKVDIHFRNEDGNRTSQILDTDTEIYLYYENNNSNNEAMTLKFQSSSTHSHFIDEQSWTIAHDDIGHKTIANADFTPWSYAYRAIIYNASIYGWNITTPLTVRNETKEEIIHYENLTTNLWFRHESDGKIDYREDMQIVSHARSNNTTLMNIDLEVWEDGAMLCYTNLTETDYSNADFPYYYMYEPIYNYVIGSNYTAKMYGFDRTLLEVRHLDCFSDNITRKNKLTIIVKNRFGSNLDNAFVYLEGYGSLPTGSNYYASYEGLDDGYYRYKATKPGYEAAGWDDVTMSDSDEVRTYTLTESTSDTATANQPKKVDDDELRNLYVCLMSFLLIFILFGGFLYVSK